ncbi:MAG: PsbP-related protein [Nitrososphaeraceae archaeon]
MFKNNYLKLLNSKNYQCSFTIGIFFIFVIIIISISENFTILQDSSAAAQQSNSTNIIKNGIKSNDFLLYENSTFGIKISYPKNWFVEKSSQETYPLTKIVNFNSPRAGDYYVTVSLHTYDYTNIPIYTLKELLNNVIDGYTLHSDIFPHFKVIYSSTDIIFHSRPGYLMIGEYEDPKLGKQTVFDIGTLKNDKLYNIQYCASPSQYQNYLPTIGNMIRSFEIKDLDNKIIMTGEPEV